MILPVTEAELAPAAALARRCLEPEVDLRAEICAPDRGSLGARIRAARHVPYQAVVGPAEAAAGHVALRLRDGRRLAPGPAEAALRAIRAAAASQRAQPG